MPIAAAKQAAPVVRWPGTPITTNGNTLVALHVEARVVDAGVFYPITPSTEMGELFQASVARGELNVFGAAKLAVEAEGEHAAQGGAIACSITGKRVANFTSGQGVLYGLEQYHHAPGKLSTMVLQVAARAITKHALNVHCGHDDIYACLDTGWTILFAKDAQQAADQALILRKVCELSLTPGINTQDGFLTSHLERTFLRAESGLIREFLGRADDQIDCPNEAQRALFGPTRRRVPEVFDLRHPALLGSVQNQEHYMQGVAARRQHFVEPILGFLEAAYAEFGALTGRHYGLVSQSGDPDADVVFVALGSAAENIEAAVEHIHATRGDRVGVLHINVLRPFPEAAVLQALRGKKQVIVLERTDDQLSGDGPLARDLRTALMKALENSRAPSHAGLPALRCEDMPRIFSGVYGLGSRDFRPEGVLGALDFVRGRIARQDGKRADDGASFFYVGIDHPCAVLAADTPSLLPPSAIAVRFHSIGGWGMITTGKNLSEVLGDLGRFATERSNAHGTKQLHISANPKYGSEKKGAPTSYFLVVADERIRVNCDLRHVDVVLCCDPRAFLHSNPLAGLNKGGAFVWESAEPDDAAFWSRIPTRHRQEIMERGIRLFSLDGFGIARETTPRTDLQYRMQGNSFLGAFFAVSSFLQDHDIPPEEFRNVVAAQYKKRFGKLGDAVVQSNLSVMDKGMARVRTVRAGAVDAPDKSSMRGAVLCPIEPTACGDGAAPCTSAPLFDRADYDSEYRAGLGYDTPSSPRASTGLMAAATGATNSKYGARRQVPVWVPENCTQCMACIVACPDTAMPNTAQDLGTVLRTMVARYVSSVGARTALLAALPQIEPVLREAMKRDAAKPATEKPAAFDALLLQTIEQHAATDATLGRHANWPQSIEELRTIAPKLPAAYAHCNMIFATRERKQPGSGGVFSIFISDLCKGCSECVEECGDHNALVMVDEGESLNADHVSATEFLRCLPDTPRHHLGQFDPDHPMDARAAALQFHLMVQSNYQALVSGDGACAGCGEKSVLRAVATISEAFMRPTFHAKAERLAQLATALDSNGVAHMQQLAASAPEVHARWRSLLAQVLLGIGGENAADTAAVQQGSVPSDAALIAHWTRHLRAEAHAHRSLQVFEGARWNGMAVMGMAASTGCNTVFGSTHPANPHPYPWMNSLFQDGATVGWLLSESFIMDHARRSVVPERLAHQLLSSAPLTEADCWKFTHFTDTLMSDTEVLELPRIWAVGGDGAFGDIGFQNVSKAVLQNRPNLKILLLDTQVYSNTGGQNSDSSPMPGGFDMNQLGAATEGKLTEKKSVAEAFTSGHGSPYIAQVSMANAAALYRVLLEALAYRGTAFVQSFTTCQPEHGVADHLSSRQAQLARDSRGMPEFVCDPTKGELESVCLSLKGNPQPERDWSSITHKASGEKLEFTVANWAYTEARFRSHFRSVRDEELTSLQRLDDVLLRITQQDVVHRRFLDPTNRAYVPADGAWTRVINDSGKLVNVAVSRQLVLWCVERRKAWRLLQSRAGLRNLDALAQAQVLQELAAGKLTQGDFMARTRELVVAARDALSSAPR